MVAVTKEFETLHTFAETHAFLIKENLHHL